MNKRKIFKWYKTGKRIGNGQHYHINYSSLISGKQLRPQLHLGTKEVYVPPIKTSNKKKPIGGLWTSTYTPKQEYQSGWEQFVYEGGGLEDRHTHKGTLLIPKPSAKIFRINSLKDLEGLYEKYPATDRIGEKTIDWEKASKELDAIHLTSHGESETRMPQYPRVTRAPPKYSELDLYGWDTESTLWLNPSFSQEQINIKRKPLLPSGYWELSDEQIKKYKDSQLERLQKLNKEITQFEPGAETKKTEEEIARSFRKIIK